MMPDHKANAPSCCTWIPGAESPHLKVDISNNRNTALSNALEIIGQTPMVKLNKIPQAHGVKCEIYVKCEFFNPGGSVKDRIAYRMVQDAEAKGILSPASTIIEPTSGNTGIGLALAAAVRGYRCIIVMPQKMSNEKLYTLQALGAQIIRTPTEASWDSPEGHLAVAENLRKKIPNSVILNQYINPGNPLAHYDSTAEEIYQQAGGKLDYLVAGAGTGGTITGIGRKFREISPNTKIIGVDPYGSILAEPEELNKTDKTFYDVEGIGYDFIPTVIDRNVVDQWIKSDDKESFLMARELIKSEGLLCGASSGSALAAAVALGKTLPADKKIVVLLPDGIRNYMTKFISDDWMIARGYMNPPTVPEGCDSWWNKKAVDILNGILDMIEPLTTGTTCKGAINILTMNKKQLIPIVKDNRAKGFIDLQTIRGGLLNGTVKISDPADLLTIKQFFNVPSTATLGRIAKILEKQSFIFIVDEFMQDKYLGVVTQQSLLDYIQKL